MDRWGVAGLWTWSITPDSYTHTVVFIHGFLDHSALSLPLFEFLNDQNCRIIAYDLPGHGRSEGPRAGLKDFDGASFMLTHVLKGEGTLRVSKRNCSSSKEFNMKKKGDPLGIERMPLNWPRAMIQWEDKLGERDISYGGPILVLQGERDHVVLYERNLKSISTWFPQAQIHSYHRLMHQILNDEGTEDLYGDLAFFLKRI